VRRIDGFHIDALGSGPCNGDQGERFFAMMDNTDPTRRYTIEVKDLVSNETVMLTAVDWTDTDKRFAVAQITRVAKGPADNCFAALVTPEAEQRCS
jgi:hypothetical protein